MGSWNATCSLSKLPIFSGEEVVLFVLSGRQKEYINLGESLCLTSDLYSYVGLPLYGTYDDYGSIELHESDAEYNKVVHRLITRFDKNLRAKSLKDVLRDIERGNVCIMYRDYNQMMVKRDIWEQMVEFQGRQESYFYNPFQERGSSHNPIRYIDHYRDVIERLSQMVVSEEMGYDLNDRDTWDKRHDFERFSERCFPESGHYEARQALYSENSSPRVKDELLRITLTNALLDSLRMGWIPQFGTGSQDSEVSAHRALALLTIQGANDIERRFREEDEWDDEDDESVS